MSHTSLAFRGMIIPFEIHFHLNTFPSGVARIGARGGKPGGVLDFVLDGGVPPGPRDPNPCLEVKKVPMFRDFAQKMDPCLGIF